MFDHSKKWFVSFFRPASKFLKLWRPPGLPNVSTNFWSSSIKTCFHEKKKFRQKLRKAKTTGATFVRRKVVFKTKVRNDFFSPLWSEKKKKRSKIRRRRQKVAFVAKRTFNLSTLTEVVENLL